MYKKVKYVAKERDDFQKYESSEEFLIFYLLLQNEWKLNLCLFCFEQHITKVLPVVECTLNEPCPQVFQYSPHHVFWYHRNLLLNCNHEVIISMWSSGIHFYFEVPSEEVITGREIRETYRPW
jgi:hypothetical protein